MSQRVIIFLEYLIIYLSTQLETINRIQKLLTGIMEYL